MGLWSEIQSDREMDAYMQWQRGESRAEQNESMNRGAMRQMGSPTFHQQQQQQSAPPILTTKTRKRGGRSKSGGGGGGGSLLSSVNLLQQPYDMIHDESSNSPYYKGLTDQSLAILDPSAPHQPPPHNNNNNNNNAHAPCYPIPIPIPTTNIFHHLSSGYSPYYKGLTDFSLVIDSWRPVHHPSHPLSYQSSPYYRGLTDNSLVLPSSMLKSTSACTGQQHIMENLTSFNEFKTNMALDDGDAFVTEKKQQQQQPLIRERGSEVVGSASQETCEQTVLEELVTGGGDDGVGLVIEELLSEEVVSSEENMVDSSALVEEISLKEMDQLMTDKGVSDDDVELLVTEQEGKPLRERSLVLEASKVENSALVEEDKNSLDEEMEKLAVIEQEKKPLRERVSDHDESITTTTTTTTVLETTTSSCSLKPLSADSGEAASNLACKAKEETAEEGSEYQYLWATMYQPLTLSDFICNKDIALQLQQLVREGCGCNHFIFEGPPNAGKRSMIRAMLREVFGADKVQVIEERKDFYLKGEMVDKVQVNIKKSDHHVEVNLSETKGYEKHVIVDLFKETHGKIINNSLPCSPQNCQAIILYEAEKLSIESLLYIKWLLEKYKGCNKVFFCCSDQSKLQPIRSLCTILRLSPPSTQEILKILEYIGEEEGKILSRDLVKKIILGSKNNLRQAIRSLEATCLNKDSLKDDDLILTGWECDISNIAKCILKEQSPRQLYLVRRKLQNLMIHDVRPDFVYKSLVAELTTLIDDASLRSGFAKLDKEYSKASEMEFETVKQLGYGQNKQGWWDERNNEPTKRNTLSYLKVEEFIAKFMSWYKNSTEKSNRHVQLIAGT